MEVGRMEYNFDQLIDRSNTDCEKWDGLKERFNVEDVISMWVADTDFQSPQPVIDALKQRAEHGVYGYTQRSNSYFESIVNWLEKRHDWKIDKKWISHSPGIIPALTFIITTFTKPGDGVLIQPPVYHHFDRIIKAQDRRVLNNPLKLEDGRYSMDFEDLEKKIDENVKMLILCNPHNPVGRVWSREELTRLGEICIKNNILVVSDEIHFDLVYKDYKHTPFASISEEFSRHSITCIAPGKTFNVAGLQTSSVIISNDAIREAFNLTMNNFSLGSPNVFGITALEAAYRYGEEWLEQLMSYLQGNLDFLVKFFAENIPEIKVIQPEGTYLVWLDCRELGFSVDELDRFMLVQARVAMNEGYTFGENGEGFMRMNIGCPRSIVEKSLHQIQQAVNGLCIKK
jgi:cysteine-S-conjugate beta-lyase